MACCLPVVASDAGGVADMLPDGEASGGVIVPRDDPVALAAALDRLLRAPATAAELGARARQRVVAAFGHAAVGRQLRSVLLSEPRSA